MTLRRRLFLILGGLAACLILAQWWWVRTLTRELSREVDSLAMVVGSSVATMLTAEGSMVDSSLDLACPPEAECEQRVRVVQRLAQPQNPIVVQTPAGLSTFEPRSYTMRFKADSQGEVTIDEILADNGAEPTSAGEARWMFKTLIEHSDDILSHHDPDHHNAAETLGQDDAETTVEIHGEASILPSIEVINLGTADHPTRFHFFGYGDDDSLHHDDRFLVLDRPDGTARVPIPRRGMATKLDNFRSRLMLGSIGLLALALSAAALLAHRVSAPLRGLASAADEVGAGELGVQVENRVSDREVQRTIDAFNLMSKRLVELDARARNADALRHLGEIGDIARGLAHTLRNPLNALGLSVDELAHRVGDEDDSNELADGAQRQIRRIDRGIRSFLVLASPTGGAVEPVDVGELVRDVALEALQDSAGRARVDVEVPELPARLNAVGPELRAAIQALVVNAVEASPDDSLVEVRLRPKPEISDDNPSDTPFVLTVDDRGPGLPTAIRERLFTPHLSTKSNGSGMGLFLAHRVAVHRYGGCLELLDLEDGGTRARLEIGPRQSLEAAP